MKTWTLTAEWHITCLSCQSTRDSDAFVNSSNSETVRFKYCDPVTSDACARVRICPPFLTLSVKTLYSVVPKTHPTMHCDISLHKKMTADKHLGALRWPHKLPVWQTIMTCPVSLQLNVLRAARPAGDIVLNTSHTYQMRELPARLETEGGSRFH